MMTMTTTSTLPATGTELARLRQLAANTIRCLAMDAVQKANSGHPGMPMGMADVATVLWTRFLKFNPADPKWPDRDRFVLSAGHGSMLLYSLLHLTGYDLPLSELKNFRQWGSRTPGHPEYGLTPGVETTTGPLGQGISNAVGMALAERRLAAIFNKPDFEIVNHYTYVIASDGDMMEGISHESSSLAGHLELGKLIVLYDNNSITIDGSTSLAFTEDTVARYAAYGWHTQRVDGHDPVAVEAAIAAAQAETKRPSFIACKTHIGFGSPHKQDTNKAHGEPLGEEEVRLVKEKFGFPPDQTFVVPEEAREFMQRSARQGAVQQKEWEKLMASFAQAHPEQAAGFRAALGNALPAGWDSAMPTFPVDKPIATRAASGSVLDAIAPRIPTLVGGSGDLTPSNNTDPKGARDITPEDYSGQYIRFGVREHGMGAIMNGMALHGGIRPYGGTFLIFSDYMRPSIRLAAIMQAPVIFVYTHDSIGLGEDGPTHQPIEQLSSLRLIPHFAVFRPADATETVECWRSALNREGPCAIVLTRQALPIIDRTRYAAASGVARGGYILKDADQPQVILIGTGSEVQLAVKAQEMLAAENIRARVVSMTCTRLFDDQPAEYRESVLPNNIRARVAVEAGATMTWGHYVGLDGAVVGLDRFGASAPATVLFRELGITAEAVVQAARETLKRVGITQTKK
jgi:transketolase